MVIILLKKILLLNKYYSFWEFNNRYKYQIANKKIKWGEDNFLINNVFKS